MAISNVRSSEYRAAGGRAWNKVKSGNRGIRMARQDKHMTRGQVFDRQLNQDREDKYQCQKAKIRAMLAEGYDESLVKKV